LTATQAQLTLDNGVEMPALGLGVFQTPPDVRALLDSLGVPART
jgi:diketogulonate reductase-like aldo/keto reductase